MLREKDLHDFLLRAGITCADTVLVHSSMRALGEVEGGCDGLIDYFKSYLTDGLLVIPTHTWASVGRDNPVYDVSSEPPCTGALSTVAAFRADAVRSLHPTHSVAAFGKRAEEFVRGEENAGSPCSKGGVWQRLYDEDAKILLIGVGLDRNTYIHAIDEMLALPGRLTEPFSVTVIDKERHRYSRSFSAHGVTGSKFFENYRAPLEALGAMRTERLGMAKVGVVSAVRSTHIIKTLWKNSDYNLCGEAREIPRSYYPDHREISRLMKADFIKDGSERITSLINQARAGGQNSVTISGKYEISSPVRIPSDFTVFLRRAHLAVAEGAYTNIFVNEHHGTEIGRTLEGTDRNIAVIGDGVSVLDGGSYNGLSEKTQKKNGLPPVWKNNLVLFTNVDGFEVSGIRCVNQGWWALNFLYARHGVIRKIHFEACDVGIDSEGKIYHGLRQDKYSEVLIKNADGIDIRQGSQNILIEDISGFTEDDTVALTGLNGEIEREFAVEGLPSDISDITVRRVSSSAFCAIVRLLNQGGIKLHGVRIEDIYDTSDTDPRLDRGGYAVRIGDSHLYDGARYALESETYDICIRGVRAAGIWAISLYGEMKEPEIAQVECAPGTLPLRDERTK